MADQWYFARVESRLGPFSSEQLKELAVRGDLRPQDLVWKEGTIKGVLAARVEHLFVGPPTIPPPAAPISEPATPGAQPPVEFDLDNLQLADGEPSPWKPAEAAAEPEPEEAQPRTSPPRQPEAREKRIVGVKGGTVMSQDDGVVKYRKKCLECGYMDTSVSRMPIRSGMTRSSFFCPKCKKNQAVEVQGVG